MRKRRLMSKPSVRRPARRSKEELAIDRAHRAREDEKANELYARLNPEPFVRIVVSKAECIKRVREGRY